MTENSIAINQVTVSANRKRTLSHDVVAALAQSIAEIGLLQPIVVTQDGRLVSGLHRLEACRMLGWDTIPCRIVAYDDLEAELAEIDENLMRADLTVLERAEHLKRRKEIYEAKYPETKAATGRNLAKKRWDADAIIAPAFVDDTAAKMQVSRSTVAHEVQIATAIVPEVRDAIRDTEVADCKTDLLLLARMEPQHQQAVAEVISAGQANGVKQAQRCLQKQQHAQVVEVALPQGKYHTIVIDPPWPMDKILLDKRPNQDAMDYPTMTLDDIAALPIPDLADGDGCHVYLWVTHKYLPAGLDMLKAWGAKYQCIMTWVKNVGFTPFSWMYSTEHVLFAHIGTLPLLRNGMRLDFASPRREHSRKPDVFYDLVREASPEPRLDMFSREARDGFSSWGNEVSKFNGV